VEHFPFGVWFPERSTWNKHDTAYFAKPRYNFSQSILKNIFSLCHTTCFKLSYLLEALHANNTRPIAKPAY
jgi:hypothetical protein